MTGMDERIDRLRLTPQHVWIFLISTTIVLLDGYDGSALAFAAPALTAELHFEPSSLGPIFSAHLVGMVIGSALFGILADRRGRRPAIILSTLIFTVFTALTAFEHSFNLFILYRFLTGIGLGGAASNAIAVSSEFAPARIRTTVVSIVYSAFPLGSVFGGYLSIWLIQDYGWRSIFLVGAGVVVPVLLFFIMTFPESVRFMREQGAPPERIAKVLRKLGMSEADIASLGDLTAPTHSVAATSSPVSALFVDGMWKRTTPLWLTFFVNQVVVYFLFMWMPTIMKTWGLSVSTGIVASATQSLGGVVGAFCLARLIDKRGPFGILVVAYLIAFLLAGAVGSVAASGAIAIIGAVAVCGFFLNGSNVNLAGVATELYPTSARSTGVGWAMGIGKAGGIAGSMIGGVMLKSAIPLPLLYPLAACPLLIASASMWYLGSSYRKRPGDLAVTEDAEAILSAP
jgi:AAHS family 4-hydroxybenzoate transporter-like MFS transporter